MHYQYVPYMWPLVVSAAVTLSLAVYAIKHRNITGAFPFGLCMLVTAFWSAGYVLEMSGTDLATKLFWTYFQAIAYTSAPVIWLIMVFRFIRRDSRVTRPVILALLILPAAAVVLAWTNDLHGLMWQNIRLVNNGLFLDVEKTWGPGFAAISIYSYLLNALSLVLLLISLRRKAALYRQQSLALFIGLALIHVPNILLIFGIYPFTFYDLTSAMTGISGLIIAWGIFRFRLFDITPVARDDILENMSDGLVVLDTRNRIVDMNLAARTIFSSLPEDPIGQPAVAFFKGFPLLADIGHTQGKLPGELVLPDGASGTIYEISCLPLLDRQKRKTGLSITFQDVTERRMAQTRLLEQQSALARAEEKDRLARDLHDNLGQVFGFINVQAQAIKRELSNAGIEVASRKIDRLVEAAQSAHSDMRQYIQNAKNDAASEMDLGSSLQKEIDQQKRQTGIDISLDVSETALALKLPPGVKSNLLNIVKEALNNIRKHAQAQKASINISTGNGILCVKITDDGLGFSETQSEKQLSSGLGLNIMRERAKEMGGDLEILSTHGQGTQIIVKVQIKDEVNENDNKGIAGR